MERDKIISIAIKKAKKRKRKENEVLKMGFDAGDDVGQQMFDWVKQFLKWAAKKGWELDKKALSSAIQKIKNNCTTEIDTKNSDTLIHTHNLDALKEVVGEKFFDNAVKDIENSLQKAGINYEIATNKNGATTLNYDAKDSQAVDEVFEKYDKQTQNAIKQAQKELGIKDTKDKDTLKKERQTPTRELTLDEKCAHARQASKAINENRNAPKQMEHVQSKSR